MGWWDDLTEWVSDAVESVSHFFSGEIDEPDDRTPLDIAEDFAEIDDNFDRDVPPIESEAERDVDERDHEGWDFSDMVDELDLDDRYAQDLLAIGWYDEDADPNDRMGAREAFFDYMGWDYDDFPWEEWREYYEGA